MPAPHPGSAEDTPGRPALVFSGLTRESPVARRHKNENA